MAKIVIIGLGHVGLAYLENLIFDKSISGEVVLIDNDEEKTRAFNYDNILDKEKTIDLGDEINKCFSENFDNEKQKKQWDF